MTDASAVHVSEVPRQGFTANELSHLKQQLTALQRHLAGGVEGHLAGSPLVGLDTPLRGCDGDEATVQPPQEAGPLIGLPAVLQAIAAIVDDRHCAHRTLVDLDLRQVEEGGGQ